MNSPSNFSIQRNTLARFRTKIPFLALIPDDKYYSLYPSEWYEPFGVIEQARRELEEKLNCHVMTFKRQSHRPFIPWDKQLYVYVEEADLTVEQRAIVDTFNEVFRDAGIEFEAYRKPLQMRKTPLEHPFAHCEPPEETQDYVHEGIDPNDIPF